MKIKPLTIVIAIAIVGLTAMSAACQVFRTQLTPQRSISGSGNVVTESRDVSGFTAVSLEGLGLLVIDQTGSETLTITADDNLLPYIETQVRGGTLIIGLQDNTTLDDITELTYHVTADQIDAAHLNGAGAIQMLHLDRKDWDATISGVGSITVSGKVEEQAVELNGAGAYNAEDLESQKATVEHNGAGLAVVQVSDQLDVDINGIGIVEYIGSPTVEKTLNGPGAVRQR